jgi:uncharacterized protein (DUF1501 family)
VQLIGGNDGLNTVIPYRDPAYAPARPRRRVPKESVLPMEGNADLGFHPALTGLRDLYRTGHLAIVQGVGYPQPNRSHFESQTVWDSGDPTLQNRTLGWAGRLLDQLHDLRGEVAQGIAIEDLLPLSMTPVSAPVQTVPDVAKFGIQFRDRFLSEKSAVLDAYQKLYAMAVPESEERGYARRISREAFEGSSTVLNAIQNYQPKASYPATAFGKQIQSIAQLILGGVTAQVYHVFQNGYDHHSDQLTKHGPLLQELGDSLSAFYQDLQAYHLEEDVTVVVYTEFGRRVQENGSLGTDHGVAGITFVFGGQVRGGLYGDYPSLTDLDEGDLKFNVDFRSVYATLIDNWLGGNSADLLGGTFPLLNFLS